MFIQKIIQTTLLFSRRYLTWLSAFIFIAIASTASANQLTASVDRNEIGLQETITLIITADEQTRSEPDLTDMRNDFEVLGNSRSQSIRIINGHTESSTDWHITLAPKHTGKLLIPSFKIDDAVSDAIEVNVSKQSQTQSAGNDPVSVITDVEKGSAFVQEQILVKVKLITQVNLAEAKLQPLELKNAIVIALDEKQYQTTINGKPQLTVETSYAIFPQESGDLVIPSLTYSVAVAAARDVWGDPFGRRNNSLLRLRTEEKHIEIKAAPDKNIVSNWQPANKFTLNEGWSGNLDHLKIGEPITRTITMMADGLTGGQIAPLQSENIDGLTFYPDQAQTKDEKSANGIKGIRTETMAIIPNRSGEFTLPELTVNWWDNKTQTMQTAKLPAKTLTVLADAKATIPTAELPTPIQPAAPAEPTIAPKIEVVTANSIWLWVSNILFIVLSLFLGFYVLKLKSTLKSIENEQSEANEIISEKEKHIWDLLKHSAASNDAAALRKAVIAWGIFQWPDDAIHSLDDIAKLGKNIELTQALKKLDENLYSNHPEKEWDATQLLQLLNECRKEKNRKKKKEGLKPLYNS